MSGRRHKAAALCIMLAAFFVLVWVRWELHQRAAAAETLPRYAGETVAVEGRVVNDPEERATSIHLHLKVEKIDDAAGSGKLLLIAPPGTAAAYGDRLSVRGEVELPRPFETDAGREFDYPHYLEVRGISALMRYASVECLEEGGSGLQKLLFSLKHAFERSIEKVIDEPQASLLEGVVLGERRGIPQELTDAFVKTGLVHVVVLSGYNLTIVAEAVLRGLAFLPRTAALGAGGALMILFALMTGGAATTVRALLMALIALVARYLRRPALALRALAFAAAGMVVWNPLSAAYDPSFILSVLATFGLITLSPWVESKLLFIPEWSRFALRSIAASTIAVQLYVLPALLYFTGILSFVALPANLLVLPVVSYAMLAGFAAGLLGLVHPVLAFVPALAADMLLQWMLAVAQVLGALPFASTTAPPLPAWLVILVYVPLTWFAISKYRRSASLSPTSSDF